MLLYIHKSAAEIFPFPNLIFAIQLASQNKESPKNKQKVYIQEVLLTKVEKKKKITVYQCNVIKPVNNLSNDVLWDF